jgi:hypothetical protein
MTQCVEMRSVLRIRGGSFACARAGVGGGSPAFAVRRATRDAMAPAVRVAVRFAGSMRVAPSARIAFAVRRRRTAFASRLVGAARFQVTHQMTCGLRLRLSA